MKAYHVQYNLILNDYASLLYPEVMNCVGSYCEKLVSSLKRVEGEEQVDLCIQLWIKYHKNITSLNGLCHCLHE